VVRSASAGAGFLSLLSGNHDSGHTGAAPLVRLSSTVVAGADNRRHKSWCCQQRAPGVRRSWLRRLRHSFTARAMQSQAGAADDKQHACSHDSGALLRRVRCRQRSPHCELERELGRVFAA
jgi:hypothetical protein